jgi:hypothetical protein
MERCKKHGSSKELQEAVRRSGKHGMMKAATNLDEQEGE